jgi:peptidoglycan hydrolase-like protein with peptidoglycan-binding domain
MSSPSLHRRSRRPLGAVAALLTVALTLVIGTAERVSAHNTVVFDGAGEAAPHIGLIGDSTLSGVRWWASYGDLRRYNFILDAESCRRTLEQSCWSREDYRPDNAVLALQRLSGQWGEVLVVMSGYNDSGSFFDDAVDAVVAEAQEQAIPHVIWLTLRTDVSYHDPQQRANANGYREDNRLLYEKSAEYDGYLQIADWATYAEDRSDWFSYDGVHLTPDGVSGLTTFIADNVDAVLAGASLNPDVAPWTTLEKGDSGTTVADVQQALLDAGVTTVGRADGAYGELTAEAVAEFQQARGLTVTGAVDEPTARALGVHGEADIADEPEQAPSLARRSPAPNVPPRTMAAPDTTERSPSSRREVGVTLASSVAAVAAAALLVRNRRRRAPADEEWNHDEPATLVTDDSFDDVLPVIASTPYDREREDMLVR